MNSPEMTDATATSETTRELDVARAKYRGKIIQMWITPDGLIQMMLLRL